MYRIVYTSRAVVVFDAADLGNLARDASARNQKSEVTGLLLYDGATFIQALEGERWAVEATMARIADDQRHDLIQYHFHGPANDRQFGDWSMDVKRAPSGCCSAEFLRSVKADVAAVADSGLKAAFIGFARLSAKSSSTYRGANAECQS